MKSWLKEKAGFNGERSNDVLIFVEHPHVYTLGKSGDPANLLKSDEELKAINAEYVKIDRGGDITYHGPGKLSVILYLIWSVILPISISI